ncbi:DUF397 domain-containing protein [Streptomyces silvensis]|uniref:DUF397 domain-containing protein n=1 Tax=Streptomyces silvensis TaxID=1765722 RepID=UPI00099ED5C2|nr:DUF397 domain-containing protein [Streptomyces silvensis]
MSSQPTEWFKSSHSGQNGECVEVRSAVYGLDVRDSKASGDPVLAFTAQAWTVFLLGVEAGNLEVGPRSPRRP